MAHLRAVQLRNILRTLAVRALAQLHVGYTSARKVHSLTQVGRYIPSCTWVLSAPTIHSLAISCNHSPCPTHQPLRCSQLCKTACKVLCAFIHPHLPLRSHTLDAYGGSRKEGGFHASVVVKVTHGIHMGVLKLIPDNSFARCTYTTRSVYVRRIVGRVLPRV